MARKHQLPLRGVISDGAAVIIRETELGHLTQLAGWASFPEAAGMALKAHSLPFPTDYQTPVRSGTSTGWRIAPDRMLVHSQHDVEMLQTDELVTLDLSDARICLSVSGEGAAGLLSRMIALDFSERAFPVGTYVQTSLHHVGVLIERQERDGFFILIPTTWARSLTDLLVTHLAISA